MRKLLVVLANGWAVAAIGATLPKYAQEVSVNGRLDSDSDINISLEAGWGYLVADNFEVGARGNVGLYGDDDKELAGGLFCEYNFEQNAVWLPYVGGELGVTWVDRGPQNKTCAHLSGWGGVKYFFTRTMAFAAQAQVWGATEPVYPADKKLTQTDWAIVLGTKFYF
ncbi:MAG: hypothetical protein ACUVWX_14070 [Kiritimatiellia bacterium]